MEEEGRTIVTTEIVEPWPREKTLQLIEAYREQECLWKITHPDYYDRFKRNQAWYNLASISGCEVRSVEKKIKSLRTQFTNYYKLTRQRPHNGGEGYKPKWFAYEALKFVIQNRRGPRGNADPVQKDEMARERGEEFSQLQEQTTMQVSNPDSPDERPTATKTHFITVKPSRRKLSDDVHHHHHHLEQQQQQVYQDSSAEYHQPASTSTAEVKDEFSIFADYVASELRTIGERRALAVAKHNINTVLFEATTGMYDQQQQSNGDQ